MPKKLLLINPVNYLRKGLTAIVSVRRPPLGLGVIASLTPSDWEIEIIDENFNEFQYKDADLVGITAFTPSAYRAYDIAKIYNDKGIPTVIGGIHASMVPDEASHYVKTVVVGEAESVWGNLIKDFESGNLQKMYKGELLECKDWPIPRHDLFHKGYVFDSILTSRGCPMKCNYCSVTLFNGYKYRLRPIDEVIREIKMINKKNIHIIDNNIIGYDKQSEERALELFRRIIDEKLKIDWISQASINFAENDEVLRLAAKSGCRSIFIGFEAEHKDQLKELNKGANFRNTQNDLEGAKKYKEVIKKINKHQIAVHGGFMMGMDTDTLESIKDRQQFIIKSKVNIMSCTAMSPMPGTVLYKKMQEENRLTRTNYPEDWQHYDFCEVLIKPKNMTAQELNSTVQGTLKRFFSLKNILIRTFITFMRSKNAKVTLWAFITCYNRRNKFIVE
jgi:radical SAM superfamily enzyme YgiQ (UPF0313 family)